MDFGGREAANEAAKEADVLGWAIVEVMTELAVRSGQDPDGSVTIGRLQAAVGRFEQVGRAVGEAEGPWSDALKGARAAVRAKLRRREPLLSRLAFAAANEA